MVKGNTDDPILVVVQIKYSFIDTTLALYQFFEIMPKAPSRWKHKHILYRHPFRFQAEQCFGLYQGGIRHGESF